MLYKLINYNISQMEQLEQELDLNMILSLISLAWALMGFIFINKEYNSKSPKKRYSFSILFVYSLTFIIKILSFYFNIENTIIGIILYNSIFLFGPLLYLYYKELLNSHINNWKIVLFHFIPFLLTVIYNIIHNSFNNSTLGLKDVIIVWGGTLSILTYGIIIFKDIKKYNKFIDNQFSNHESNITLSWLKILSIGYISLFTFSFLILFLLRPNFLNFPREITHYFPPEFIMNIPLSFFIFDFVLNCPNQKIINIDLTLPIKNESPIKNNKIINSEILQEVKNLDNYMEEKKPYLDSNLSLDKLSNNIGISRHKLSLIITNGCNSTFYNYINKYRIDEFEDLINKGKYKNFSILGLAYECGFKGSSSFYNALKKQKNLTPKQFISQIEAKK